MPIAVKVEDVMEGEVHAIEGAESAARVLERMIKGDFWSVLVQSEGLPVGVVTDRDILKRAVAPGKDLKRVKVEEIMSSPIITISPKETIGHATSLAFACASRAFTKPSSN